MIFLNPMTTSDDKPLMDEASLGKRKALEDCEKVIQRNFISLGASLQRIRDEGLWMFAKYPEPSPWKSFEDYCDKVHELSKGYVSRLISASQEAITMAVLTGIEMPTEPVATALRKVPEDIKSQVLESAALKATQAGRPLNSADIQLSRLEAMGAIPLPVKTMAEKLDWAKDPDRMDVLLNWYATGKDNPDSKFWSAYASGVLDPADGGAPVALKTASLREIHRLELRWKAVVEEIFRDDPTKLEWTGVAADDISIDGQMVRIKGKKVKITVIA